jgi:hypothetical protein
MRGALGVVQRSEEGVVRFVTRGLLVAVVVVACAIVSGVASSSVRATTAPGPKAAETISNIHTLQVVIETYAEDHNGRYPRYETNRRFRALLAPYCDRWPVNPWSHRSMRQKRNRGNFTYRRHGDRFSLIGWGPHGRRIIVVP